jgi:hypothetical protein
VVAHNVHESEGIGCTQEGGTGLLMFGPLTDYLDMPASEKDATGLGRWSTMLLKGEGVQTRIFCGYNPCVNRQADNRTSYCRVKGLQLKTGCPVEDYFKLLHLKSQSYYEA